MSVNLKLKASEVLKYFVYHPKADLLQGTDRTVARTASTLLSLGTLGIAPLACRWIWQGSDAAEEIRKKAIRALIQTAPQPTPPYPSDLGKPYAKILKSEHGGMLFLGSIEGLALASGNTLKEVNIHEIIPSHNPEKITDILSLCSIAEIRILPISPFHKANRPEIVRLLRKLAHQIHIYPFGETIPDQGARGDLISALLLYIKSLDHNYQLRQQRIPLSKTVKPLFDILITHDTLTQWCKTTLKNWEKQRKPGSSLSGSDAGSFETYFYQHLIEIEPEAILAFQREFDHSGWALLVHACSESIPQGIAKQEVLVKDRLIASAEYILGRLPVEEWFEPAFQIIDRAVFGNARVFVHCQAGRSRSPAVLAAYLINRFDVTADEALNFLATKRPQVNSKFLYELRDYAEKLKAARSFQK